MLLHFFDILSWLTNAIPASLSAPLHCFLFITLFLGFKAKKIAVGVGSAFFLSLSISSQMAQGPLQMPTAHRNLEGYFLPRAPSRLEHAELQELQTKMERVLRRSFDAESFATLTDMAVLEAMNESLQTLLPRLGFQAGPPGRRIKELEEPIFSMGLLYGGVAAHDVLTREILIPSVQNYPAGRAFRLRAICHEAVHARGWVHERTTVLLEILAMLHSKEPVLRSLGAYRVLRYLPSGDRAPDYWKSTLPDALYTDLEDRSRNLQQMWQHRPWLKAIREHFIVPSRLHNKSQKYGYEPDRAHRGVLYRLLYFFQSPSGSAILEQ